MHTDGGSLVVAAVAAVAAGALGAATPAVLRRLPDPVMDDAAPGPEGTARPRWSLGGMADLAAARSPYAELAERKGVAVGCALASAMVACLCTLAVGRSGVIPALAYLSAVGVGLTVVDWRSAWLPSRVIWPSYAVVVFLLPVGSLLAGEPDRLLGALWGLLSWGGLFLVLWLIHPAGIGFGDVRLSGLLGLVLGYLGWTQILVGVYAALVLGAVGGLTLRVLGWRRFPYGPFLLAGALAGVLCGPAIVSGLGL